MIRLSVLLISAICIQFVSDAMPVATLSDTASKTKFIKEDSIVSFVFHYYQPELNKLRNEEAAELQITTEEGNKQINYTKDGFSLFYRIIPSVNGFIKGDLNRDHLDDLVVSVYATGGTHATWMEVFLFLGTKDGYKFYKKYDSYSLGKVKRNDAKFYPTRIRDGLLIGRMSMLAQHDPGCCPSLHYRTAFKFIDGNFKIVGWQKSNEFAEY